MKKSREVDEALQEMAEEIAIEREEMASHYDFDPRYDEIDHLDREEDSSRGDI